MSGVLLFAILVGMIGTHPLTSNGQDVQGFPEGCTCTAGHIVDCNGLNAKEFPANPPDDAKTAYQFNVKLTSIIEIPANAFQSYPQLKMIQFVDNSLKRIDKSAFKGLPLLKELHLYSNELSDDAFDTELFEGLASLEKLGLGGNNLTTFPLKLFVNARRLVTFSAGFNQISTLGPTLDVTLANLENMFVSNNKLTSLNAAFFGQMPNLKKLYLGSNDMLVIQNGDAFVNMRSLVVLDLTGIRIHCDCQTLWMVQGRIMGSKWSYIGSSHSCATPRWMAGKEISELYPQDMTCEPPVITSITPTNVTKLRNAPLKLQATMEGGFPYSTWVAPDGSTKNDVNKSDGNSDIQYANVMDEVDKTDHSVVTTLTIDETYNVKEAVKFTLIGTNVAAATNMIFWVYPEPLGTITTPGDYDDPSLTTSPNSAFCGCQVWVFTIVVMLITYAICITK